MKYVGIIVRADPEIRLGGKIISFLRGIDEHVDQRIYHKNSEKEQGRQQIEPGLPRIIVHCGPLSADAAAVQSQDGIKALFPVSARSGRFRKEAGLSFRRRRSPEAGRSGS